VVPSIGWLVLTSLVEVIPIEKVIQPPGEPPGASPNVIPAMVTQKSGAENVDHSPNHDCDLGTVKPQLQALAQCWRCPR
jgi:hypothetical protein